MTKNHKTGQKNLILVFFLYNEFNSSIVFIFLIMSILIAFFTIFKKSLKKHQII